MDFGADHHTLEHCHGYTLLFHNVDLPWVAYDELVLVLRRECHNQAGLAAFFVQVHQVVCAGYTIALLGPCFLTPFLISVCLLCHIYDSPLN